MIGRLSRGVDAVVTSSTFSCTNRAVIHNSRCPAIGIMTTVAGGGCRHVIGRFSSCSGSIMTGKTAESGSAVIHDRGNPGIGIVATVTCGGHRRMGGRLAERGGSVVAVDTVIGDVRVIEIRG